MSNKKRKNHKAVLDSLELEVSSSSPTQTSEPGSAGKRGLIAFLKSNLWMVGVICFLALGILGSGLKYLDEDARRETALRAGNRGKLNNQEQSFLNKVNPFLPPPSPTPTPQLSKSYVYAGSRLLAVEDANANAAPPADLAVWRPSNGQWWVMAGTGTQQVSQSWGQANDIPVPGDFDGDGKTDFAVFRPDNPLTTTVNECQPNCQWYVIYSSGASIQFGFGADGDQPMPADYDGDGKTDVAVFRNSNATWYISYSSSGTTVAGAFGNSGDIPAPADYDGDGRADLAVFRASNATFYSLNSMNLQTQTTAFGQSGDEPVPADYDGDGRSDIALWRSGNATWYVKQTSNGNTATTQFGVGSDTPVQNDYDGDGKVDIAVWRGDANSPDVGKWYILNSTTNSIRQESWGIAGDTPVPAFWKRQ